MPVAVVAVLQRPAPEEPVAVAQGIHPERDTLVPRTLAVAVAVAAVKLIRPMVVAQADLGSL